MVNTRRIASVLVVLLFLGVAPGILSADEAEDAERYEAERSLAEAQAADPDVLAYRTSVAPDLDAALSKTLLHCTRRELYSRRAIPDLVLTIDTEGTIGEITVRIVNRMSVCFSGSLAGTELPAPPTAPLRIVVASPAALSPS